MFNCFNSTTSDNDEDLKKNEPSPLINYGNACYINSAFQGMSACKTFVKEINDLSCKYSNKVEKLSVLIKLIDIVNRSSKDKLSIYKNQIFQQWNKSGQQDSYELMAFILNEVYNDLRKVKDEWKVLEMWLKESLPMRFIFQNEIECGCKMKSISPIQSELALHVSMSRNKENYELDKLLDLDFSEKSIKDYVCNNKECNGKGAIQVTRFILPLPHTFCVHLQRTFWNGNKLIKINNKVKFGLELVIKSSYISTLTQDIRQDQTMESIISQSTEFERKHETYNLVSVIVHSKTFFGGHYICYKRVGDKWFLTNDSRVHEVEEKDVLDCKPYILFFEQL